MTKADGPRQRSILVIEDEASIRCLLRHMLEDAGYVVTEAANGRKGLHAFRLAPPDLVITDLFMPDRDGIEVIQHLRKTRRDVKMLAISGASGTMDSFEAATAAGATAVLRKPFGIQPLLRMVAALLGEPSSATTIEAS